MRKLALLSKSCIMGEHKGFCVFVNIFAIEHVPQDQFK